MSVALSPAFEVLMFGLGGQAGAMPVWPKSSTWLPKGDVYMSQDTTPRLTPRDFRILERMIDEHDGKYGEYLIASIRKKLDCAQVIFAEDLHDDVVTIDSRFQYAIDSGAPQERRLVLPGYYVPGQHHMALETPRGIALLGLAAGNCTNIDDGLRKETLEVLKVHYQPQAHNEGHRPNSRLRMVSNQSRTDRPVGAPYWDNSTDDDPGPSAE